MGSHASKTDCEQDYIMQPALQNSGVSHNTLPARPTLFLLFRKFAYIFSAYISYENSGLISLRPTT